MINFLQAHKLPIGLVVLVILFVTVEIAFVRFNGKSVPTPKIPREPFIVGEGEPLTYVVLGDSTAVAQGSDYESGVAIGTAKSLAAGRAVTMLNFGESGARLKDVAEKQVGKISEKPDVVLVLAGSNDVTHLTSRTAAEQSLTKIVESIIAKNCDAKIAVTGSAQMGVVARFPQPIRWLAGIRTNQLNHTLRQVTQSKQLTFVELAQQTGQAFQEDDSLFAVDNFHPNEKGYAVWTPVLNQGLRDSLHQPSHCN